MAYKILYVCPVGEIGGAERCLLDIIELLGPHPEIDIHVLCFAEGKLTETLRQRNIATSVLSLSSKMQSMGDWGEKTSAAHVGRMAFSSLTKALRIQKFVRSLRREIDSISPNCVHTNGMKAHILTALASRKKSYKLIWHLRDMLSNRPIAQQALKLLVSRVDAIATDSEETAKNAAKYLGNLKMHPVQNAVDTKRFSPGAPSPEISSLFNTGKGMAVGLVATYAKWKGQKLFIEAISKCQNTEAHYFIVGGGIYQRKNSEFSRQELEDYAKKLHVRDQLSFIDFQTDTPSVYRCLDLVVHASTQPEPFGMTIAEAMGCGRAVIVSAHGGAVEIFRDKISAFGIPPNNASAMAKAIDKLVIDSEYRKKLEVQARERIAKYFNFDILEERLLSLYQSQGLPTSLAKVATA